MRVIWLWWIQPERRTFHGQSINVHQFVPSSWNSERCSRTPLSSSGDYQSWIMVGKGCNEMCEVITSGFCDQSFFWKYGDEVVALFRLIQEVNVIQLFLAEQHVRSKWKKANGSAIKTRVNLKESNLLKLTRGVSPISNSSGKLMEWINGDWGDRYKCCHNAESRSWILSSSNVGVAMTSG